MHQQLLSVVVAGLTLAACASSPSLFEGEGEGYRLMLKSGESSALSHGGKSQGEKCRPQA